jgi:hypothetical protein
MRSSSVIDRTISEEGEEEDKTSTTISPGLQGQGGSRDRGSTFSIKINGHMREVQVPRNNDR